MSDLRAEIEHIKRLKLLDWLEALTPYQHALLDAILVRAELMVEQNADLDAIETELEVLCMWRKYRAWRESLTAVEVLMLKTMTRDERRAYVKQVMTGGAA